MTEPAVRMYDIMACNVYWDFAGSGLPREQHKFLVSFYPAGDVPTPELVDRIVAHGPDGYTVELSNEAFTHANRNGWIHDSALGFYWYMVNVETGYMPEGEYTIEVSTKDGRVQRRSRHQQDGPAKALVPAYLEHRDRILSSFAPSRAQEPAAGTDLSALRCGWLTLRDVAGPDADAYYVFRLAEGGSLREFDTQRLVWWDNIYLDAVRSGDPSVGRNRGEVTVGARLRPRTSYGWFVEITDGNVQSDANICIFQPHQFFTTP